MTFLAATLALYRGVFVRTAHATLRNWHAALVTPLYFFIMAAANAAVAPLGPQIGGLALGLVQAACFSLYLHLLDEVVRGGRVRLADFRIGFRTYFWDVIRVLFFFMIVSLLLRPMLGGPEGAVLNFALSLCASLAFNALPELLYQGRNASFELLRDALQFIQQNWIEWLLPVAAFGWGIILLNPWFWRGLGIEVNLGTWLTVMNPLHQVETIGWRVYWVRTGSGLGILLAALSVFGFFFLMVFRGFLFRALAAGSTRTRMFRHQAGLD